MPELPEVETIKQDLESYVLNKKIIALVLNKEKMIQSNLNTFKRLLVGNIFKNIKRRGKLIYIELKTGEYLLIHLKMTGQLVYQDGDKLLGGGHSLKSKNNDDFGGKLPNKYSHIILKFNDKSSLYFNDMRQFGYMKIVNYVELEEILKKYGIEPLTKNFTVSNFKKAIKNRRLNIKAFLLNQNVISGIGNIYADEILFDTGILPSRSVNNISNNDIERIIKSTNTIIKKAIKYRGTTFNNYRDADGDKGNFIKLLRVYGRGGEKCVKCASIIKKIKITQRGTHFCDKCQK